MRRLYWWWRSMKHRWNLWRLHGLLLAVLILDVPVAVWGMIPSQERDRIKTEVAQEYMVQKAKEGATKFVIQERVHKFSWQLHIETVERRL